MEKGIKDVGLMLFYLFFGIDFKSCLCCLKCFGFYCLNEVCVFMVVCIIDKVIFDYYF